ncbi:MAG: hypothetical protein J6R85_01630, partial [Lentisphaeria bacterium]|nr:hypothetical protein [Lentisphaeria bacterium]
RRRFRSASCHTGESLAAAPQNIGGKILFSRTVDHQLFAFELCRFGSADPRQLKIENMYYFFSFI